MSDKTTARARGLGSIFRRADGYWVGSVDVGRTVDGKRRRKRVVRKRRADVVAAMDDLRNGHIVEATGEYRFTDGTVVYVAHGDERILYVGCTKDLFARMAAHRRRAAWWPEVRRITWEQLPTRAAALEREAMLIRRHNPPHNRGHRL